jgi:hypothetical protein
LYLLTSALLDSTILLDAQDVINVIIIAIGIICLINFIFFFIPMAH